MQPTTSTILLWTITGSIIILILFLIFIYYLIKIYNTKQLEFHSTIRLKQIENEKQILHARIEVQEETLQKISREIHDNVNQLLTLTKMHLNAITSTNSEENLSKTELSKELITSAINELTNISRTLNADIINDFGISKSLESEAERVSRIEQVKIDVQVDPDLPIIRQEIQLNIYRIFQEATRNAITHGKANHVSASLSHINGILHYSIKDNGIGFDTKKIINKGGHFHHGLNNIKKRVVLSKGELQIISHHNIGTNLIIKIPMEINQ